MKEGGEEGAEGVARGARCQPLPDLSLHHSVSSLFLPLVIGPRIGAHGWRKKEREETLPIPWIRFDREEEKIGLARKRIISDYLKVS